jgi:predicted nucleic acid-binding protein
LNFILDSSLTIAFIFSDEASAETDAVLDSLGHGGTAFVPHLWRWEIGNALLQAERRKRITVVETERHISRLLALPIDTDENGPAEAWNATLLLARKHGLTVYDAAFLELAVRRGLPLGSLDEQLREAALAEGVSLLPEDN